MMSRLVEKSMKEQRKRITNCNRSNTTFYKFLSIIKILLQLFSTLPVTFVIPERMFSSLKIIKTYLKSTIPQVRLNGLDLTKIN